MREIKFRGKEAESGKWLHGSYAFIQDKHYIITESMMVNRPEGKQTTFKMGEADPATVGQYTGLKDKNGREIWEGDILCTVTEIGSHTAHGSAKFGEIPDCGCNKRNQGFYIDWEDDGINEWSKWWRNDLYFWADKVEVIGNIHDNPDLIR